MELAEFFKIHNKIALAFSGGADSAYLMYEALKNRAELKAYYVNSAFQPRFELEDARRLASELGAELEIIEADVLSDENIRQNPPNRCYFCKQRIFTAIQERAKVDGFTEIMDGTNASDDVNDRPGMKALREMKVLSPLRECGITKDELRRRSKEAGLFTWDKPSYACLATRVPAGAEITAEMLRKTETVEDKLRALGLRDFRVRSDGKRAKLQVREEQLAFTLEKREEILKILEAEYSEAVLDLRLR